MSLGDTLAPWVDIPPLPIPEQGLNVAAMVGASLLILLIIAAVILLWNAPRFKIRRKLKRIHSLPLEAREQLAELQHVILDDLGVSRLNEAQFSNQQQEEWQYFCDMLKRYRFQAAAPSDKDVRNCLLLAAQWLERR